METYNHEAEKAEAEEAKQIATYISSLHETLELILFRASEVNPKGKPFDTWNRSDFVDCLNALNDIRTLCRQKLEG